MIIVVTLACATAQADDTFVIPEKTARMLQKHCIDCHGTVKLCSSFDPEQKSGRSKKTESLHSMVRPTHKSAALYVEAHLQYPGAKLKYSSRVEFFLDKLLKQHGI